MAFGTFGAGEGLAAGVVEGGEAVGGLPAGLFEGCGGLGAQGRGRGGGVAAEVGGLGAGAVEFVSETAEFLAGLGERSIAVRDCLFGAVDGAFGGGGALDREVAFGGGGIELLGGFSTYLFDFGGGRAPGGLDIFGGLLPRAFYVLRGFSPCRAYLGFGGAAGREDIVGRLGGDAFDFSQGVVSRGARFGDRALRLLRGGDSILRDRFGDSARGFDLPAGLLGGHGRDLRLRDSPGGVGLHGLDLRFGDGGIGQGRQFGYRGIEIGAQLFGQRTELGEQFIGPKSGDGHRSGWCHSDGFAAIPRLLLLTLPFPPRAPSGVLGVITVLRGPSGSAAANDGADTSRVVTYARHSKIVALLTLAATYRHETKAAGFEPVPPACVRVLTSDK